MDHMHDKPMYLFVYKTDLIVHILLLKSSVA